MSDHSNAGVGHELNSPCVRDLMTKELFTLHANDNLVLLDELMKWKRIRHVPVVGDEEQLVGLVTHRDFLKAAVSRLAELDRGELKDVYKKIPIESIMNRDVLTAGPDMTLSDAAKLMHTKKIGCLPIVEESGALAGIITEADFVRAFYNWDVKFLK